MTNISPVDLGASLVLDRRCSERAGPSRAQDKGKAKAAAQNFEAMFLSNMFQQMFTGIDGDGPFGGSGALKVWRSFADRSIRQELRQGRRHRHRQPGL